QEVRSTQGGEPSYIVQVPPTEADVSDVPGAYGGQGNSRDWASNLRLVAGQHPAAMDDVRAAMEEAGVPPGADVMIVGHSQGGIIANHLSADPTFNSSGGEPGTYNITHTFSVGSPVQTVVPAQGTTESVNVNHEASLGRGGFGGDLIPTTDLGGLQVDGGTLSAPNRHEVTLDPYPGTGWTRCRCSRRTTTRWAFPANPPAATPARSSARPGPIPRSPRSRTTSRACTSATGPTCPARRW